MAEVLDRYVVSESAATTIATALRRRLQWAKSAVLDFAAPKVAAPKVAAPVQQLLGAPDEPARHWAVQE